MRLKHSYSKVLLLMLALLTCSLLHAQEDLKINSIFEKYGKQKGSVMVVLSGKALNDYKLDKYRSLSIHYDKTILKDIQECIETDKHNAHKIKEVITNGIVSSGYYQLKSENNKVNRYILFKIDREHKATLIYMEGGLDSESLINKLFLKQKK